tara:strand:- start:5214 stop:5924 length:711 start_codon:yes stop_codon:yes gene_type:complete
MEKNVMYIPHSKEKINNDLAAHQYFYNMIEPNYNVLANFSLSSKTDERFKTRVDSLLEREIEMRQGTFCGLEYNHKQLPSIDTGSRTIINNTLPLEYKTVSKPTSYTPELEYVSILSPGILSRQNAMPIFKNSIDSKNIGLQSFKNPLGNFTNEISSKITYKNKLFSTREKNIICIRKMKQHDIDPLRLLDKKAIPLANLLVQYQNLYGLYHNSNPLKKNIGRARENIIYILQARH